MRADLDRLKDAHDHASHALTLMEVLSAQDVTSARDQFQSLLFDIVVIGTTLGKVSGTIRGLSHDVPWKSVIDTRNRIVHAYWQIDMEMLTVVVTITDVRQLGTALADLITLLETTAS